MGDEWAGANVGSPHLLSPRRVQCVGQYDLGKTIGSGQFGKVKLATHVLTKAKVAVKIINKTKLEPDTLVMVYREISIMKLLRHPNIIRLYEVVDTEKVLFLIMEYASGGEVLDFIVAHGRLGEKEARRFFRQILSAIAYCHKVHVVHRDLKCENLLLDKSLNIKIIDFGLSNHFTPGIMLKTFCGSPTYAAPELILKREYAGPEVDIWSMGVMLYVLVCGKLPFEGHDFLSLFTRILHADYKLPDFVSPDLASLLRSILVVDPKRRATLHQIMAHPWVTAGEDISMMYEPETPPLTAEGMDEEVLATMEKTLHFDKQATSKSVLGNKYDDAAATYLLLVERRQREREESGQSDKGALVPINATGPMPSPPPPETKQPVVPAQTAEEHKKGKGHRRNRTVEGQIQIVHQDTIVRAPNDTPSTRPKPKHGPSPLRDSPSVDSPMINIRNSAGTAATIITPKAPHTTPNTPTAGTPNSTSPPATSVLFDKPPLLHLHAPQDPPDMLLHPGGAERAHPASNPNLAPPNSNLNSNPNRAPSLPATPRDDLISKAGSSELPTPLQSPPRAMELRNTSSNIEIEGTSPNKANMSLVPEPHTPSPTAQVRRKGHQRHVSVDVHPKKEKDATKEGGGIWESVLGFKGSSRRSSGKAQIIMPPTPTPAPVSTPPMPPHSTLPPVSPSPSRNKHKMPVLKLDGVAPARPVTLVDSFKHSLGIHSSRKEKAGDEPRSGRFAFNVSTTSEKDPVVIIQDIKDLLKTMNIVYSESGQYSVDCFAGDIRFEIEVCKLPRLSISGLKMKRIAGDVWNYKATVDKLVQRLNLSDVSGKGSKIGP